MEFTKQLKDICERRQKEWEDTKIFEAAPKEGAPKFFVTFPYPYMNGKLHLGHLFSMSKAEFAAGYHRLIGENTLFPFAFHVTGQPICGAAKKLVQELKNESAEQAEAQAEAQAQHAEREYVAGQFKSKKSKATAKTGGKSQMDIMRDLGIPESDIPLFTDPMHWVDYFPSICKADLQKFGSRVDWRRSFYTTDRNPAYDAFVRWQMRKLRAGGFIKFGERFTIWSPAEAQPCLDHDRSAGEGLQAQEYTLVLAEVLRGEPHNAELYESVAENERIYLACATLRPETMYGQTNVWVHPDETYQLIRTAPGTVLITGARAALNLAYQRKNNGKPIGEVDLIAEIQGARLMNCLARAPLSPLERIPVLPLLTISMQKGTGVVTSVPSDAPDDYAALRDVQRDTDGISTKYGIDMSLVRDLAPIPIIRIPELGDCAAATLCEQRGVQNQHDSAKLADIKQLCYKSGFYDGVMITGPYAGQRVCDCKVQCRDALLAAGSALLYAEPEGMIISRSGSECVVALSEQWYIDYGEAQWRERAEQCLAQLDTYSDEVRNQFVHVLGWLKQWALSRTFGLGTRLPWDERVIVESLSDSTLYNAYYTIAHILQNGTLDASTCPIPHELLNDAFFDYVFDLSTQLATEHAPFAPLMDEMRSNFQYFYPVDLRCSGKDLVQNHLTFFIYTHVAIFPPKYWPRGIRANGHLYMNDQKMSKSLGNFLTAEQAIDLFSADGLRFALADAGDGNDDANFKSEFANAGIVKLCQVLRACPAMFAAAAEGRERRLCDDVFEAQFLDAAGRASAAFARCRFREGMVACFNDMQRLADQYVTTCTSLAVPTQRALLQEFWDLFAQLLSVCCPHTAEELWRGALGHTESILSSVLPADVAARAAQTARFMRVYDFVCGAVQRLNTRLQDVMRQKAAAARPRAGTIYVAVEFEPWQAGVCEFLLSKAHEGTILDKATAGGCRQHAIDNLGVTARDGKRLMKFVTDQIQQYKLEGESALATRMPFDEKEVYIEYAGLIKTSLQLERLEVFRVGEGAVPPAQCSAAAPGRPIIFFE